MDTLTNLHDHATGVDYVSLEVITCVSFDDVAILVIIHPKYDDISQKGRRGSQSQDTHANNE